MNPDRKEEALEEFKHLVSNSPLSTSTIITTTLTPHITNINPSTKDILNLLPLLLSSSAHISIKHLNDILTLLKLSITISNCPMFHFISKIFGQIVSSLYNQSQEQNTKALPTPQCNKELYSFCNDLLHNEDYPKAKGLAFLLFTELIDNSSSAITIAAEKKYIIALMDNIDKYLSNATFYHKLEVINCLLSLIYATEEKFKAYANDALYMILDYLNDNDWLIRKLCLNVVYSLSYYCFNDIMSLIEDMRQFLDELKKDDVEEVREVCIQTIELIEKKCAALNKKKSKDANAKGKVNANGNVKQSKSTKRNKENININTNAIETKLNQLKQIKEPDKIVKPTCVKKKTLKPSSSSLGGNGISDKNNSYQQPYTSNDIHSAMTGKLKLKNAKCTLKKAPNESEMPFTLDSSMNNTKSQLSFISLQKNASDISIHLKQTNANSINNGSRNNYRVVSQPKYTKDNIMGIDNSNINNNNDRVNYTQSEVNISQIRLSPFERLYSSSIRNPKKRAENSIQERNDNSDNNNKVISVNKAQEDNNSTRVHKNKSSSVKALPKTKQTNLLTKKSKIAPLSPKGTNNIIKSIPKSPNNNKLDCDLNALIKELILVINAHTEKNSNKDLNQLPIEKANQPTKSLLYNFTSLNSTMSQLDDSSLSSFLFTHQSKVVKLIKMLIDLNDFDKAISLMIKDNGLLFKCIPMIKKQRYTQISKKSIEVLLNKVIDVLSIGQDTEKLLDVITIVLNNKLSIPNTIKTSIIKSIEYLLTHNKKEIILSEQSNQSIRYIIAHLSNK